jgi:hypothetical protein
MIEIGSSSLNLKFRFKNKSLGFAWLIELQFIILVSEVHLL